MSENKNNNFEKFKNKDLIKEVFSICISKRRKNKQSNYQ